MGAGAREPTPEQTTPTIARTHVCPYAHMRMRTYDATEVEGMPEYLTSPHPSHSPHRSSNNNTHVTIT